MRTLLCGLLLTLVMSNALAAQTPAPGPAAGHRGLVLGDLTWLEAERVLTRDAVIVIPLGAEAKEHGPHLRLDNDLTLAQYYRRRVLEAAEVIVAPTVNYHFYPSFVEYPGSTTLRFETARDLIVDIVRSLAAYGPRKFYVLNTGISTLRPLAASAEILRAEGILFEYTNIGTIAGEAEARVSQQLRGTHADETETSAILYMDPARVDMSKAVKDDAPRGEGGLTRDPNGRGTYSPSGVWGDATLATRAKGEVIVEASVAGILAEIEALRRRPLP
ncbi:MAG: creatininase family protein [Gemmatimonadaceae bacterium]|nr:creatininase family protein [Gemmatimonadaceae bacterium]MCW5826916.1 creatininase family protein [Gemmatimonadaceae bacterium]